MGHGIDVQVGTWEAKDRMRSMEGYYMGYGEVQVLESNERAVFYGWCAWLQGNWSEWCEHM